MYIDFYDSKEINKYRVNLGSIKTSIQSTNIGIGIFYCFINSPMTITSLGSDLVELFNVKMLDFSKATETVKLAGNSYKAFRYHNKDETIKLAIYNYTPKDMLNLEFEGTVQTGKSLITTHYSFNSKCIRFALEVGMSSRDSDYIYLSDNSITSLPNAPSQNQGTAPASLGCALACQEIEINGEKHYGYFIYNQDIYKAVTFFSASLANPEPTSDETKSTPSGCIYEIVGKALRLEVPTNNNIANVNNKGWDIPQSNTTLYGNNIKIATDYRVISESFGSNGWIGVYDTTDPNKGKPDSTDPNPEYPGDDNPDDTDPDDGIGGDGDGDKTSDEIPDDDTVETFDPTGLITLYKLQQTDMQTLGQKLWSDNFLTHFLKITQNPIDAVIELKAFFFPISGVNTKNLMLGNFDTEMIITTVQNSIVKLDFESIRINEFFGDFKDYNPLTKISIYLPFIGVRDLNVNEVMNSNISLVYHVDIMSNDCVALLTVTKEIDETQLNSVLYQFEGNCAHNIPISAASANTIISARLSQFQSITNGAIRLSSDRISPTSKATSTVNAITNVLQSEIDANHLDVNRTGSLSGSTGHLGILTPYIIIERPVPYNPTSYNKTLGVPSNRTKQLSSLSGYTEVLQIYINNFTGLQSEYEELISILKAGVIF